ncbi:hypothetical protein DEO45_08870 [Rhodanobacter denitrificans]|uniref:Uncharacterized protein n=1 Tax=Rhodanobacter denitrificans TaxID=666685 RepID=A0A368KE16_9GAMM|nr:hypothetical protein [Rhodanobacter denitrificans]RCS30162.1 hypothetical protein DEO45_08870 [Rhodanobacter denitrificans]
MSTIRKRVADILTDAIKASPSGMRWAELHRTAERALPAENQNSIHGSIHYFASHLPDEISKPERGLYVYGAETPTELNSLGEPAVASISRLKEHDFYQPFADWLKDEVEEATVAVPLGGNCLGTKWGTPDVIALFQPRRTDPIKFSEEVIAAEIKTDTNQLIVAFGQACAYKLFAHRVYLVVPCTAPKADLQRLDALAGVVGIGLVKFNPDDAANPEFDVMARAAKHEPDYFYTNQAITKCAEALRL